MTGTEQELNSIMLKTAEYIEAVQPKLDKLASFEERDREFVKRATQAAGVLAHKGLIERDSVNELVDKIAEDHSEVWEMVEKLAESISAEDMGAASEKVAGNTTDDPFEREFFGMRTATNGMID